MSIYKAQTKNIITGDKQKYFLIDVEKDGQIQHKIYVADLERDELLSKPVTSLSSEITNISNAYDWSNKVFLHNLFDITNEYAPIDGRGYAFKNKNDIDENDAESYSDIYAPTTFSTVGIGSVGNYMYLLTDKLTTGAWYNIRFIQDSSVSAGVHNSTETLVKSSEELLTTIYPPVSDFEKVKDDFEKFSNIYSPRAQIAGIPYNHILEYPTNVYALFKDNTILTNTLIGKNHLGYDYSQHAELKFDDRTGKNYYKIPELRSYCRIGSCGGTAYLVYKNDTTVSSSQYNYNSVSADSSNAYIQPAQLTTSRIETDPSSKTESDIVKDGVTKFEYAEQYERVEVLKSVNRYSSKSIHKTNLYSIELNNLGLNSAFNSLGSEKQVVINKIKKSVRNGIRALCEKIQPGNTQLFDVYFTGF